jgi:hypothetical protein
MFDASKHFSLLKKSLILRYDMSFSLRIPWSGLIDKYGGKLQRESRAHLENPGLLLEFIPVKIGTGVTDLFSGIYHGFSKS